MAQQYKCPKCGEGTLKLVPRTVELFEGGAIPPGAKFRCDKCGYETVAVIKPSGSN